MNPTLSPQEETERSYRQNKRAMIINLVVLMIVFVIITFAAPSNDQKNLFIWEQTQLLINFPDDTVYTVPLDSITQILLIEDADPGVCLSGDAESSIRYGRWKNDTLGEYVLCCHLSYSTVIQLTTPEEVYWISYESADTTVALYETIVETLSGEGYTFLTDTQ